MKKYLNKFKFFLNKPGMFSRVLVIFCIIYCVRIVEWAMNQFEKTGAEAPTLINSALILFGGELLLLCLKRVFAKNDNKKNKTVESFIELPKRAKVGDVYTIKTAGGTDINGTPIEAGSIVVYTKNGWLCLNDKNNLNDNYDESKNEETCG